MFVLPHELSNDWKRKTARRDQTHTQFFSIYIYAQREKNSTNRRRGEKNANEMNKTNERKHRTNEAVNERVRGRKK